MKKVLRVTLIISILAALLALKTNPFQGDMLNLVAYLIVVIMIAYGVIVIERAVQYWQDLEKKENKDEH